MPYSGYRHHRLHSLVGTVRNMLRILGYLVLADSYWTYRAAKHIYSLFNPQTHIAEKPDYDHACLLIEGFPHSGNTFLRSNVEAPWRGNVIGHRHRIWTLKAASRRNIPTGLLIRDPIAVAHSMCHRSMVGGSTPISYTSSLACWILFYHQAWSYRRSVVVLPFEQLISDYDSLCDKLERISEVRFLRPPERNHTNAFTGPRPALPVSPLARALEKRAIALYEAYMTLAD